MIDLILHALEEKSFRGLIRKSYRLMTIYDLNSIYPGNTLHDACSYALMPVREAWLCHLTLS